MGALGSFEFEIPIFQEEWCGVELEPTEIYGIRRYREGSWLQLHVDRMNTHIVSAILQIDQAKSPTFPNGTKKL